MPVKAAQTASETASSVRLRSIKAPTSEKKKLHTFFKVKIFRRPLLWWIEAQKKRLAATGQYSDYISPILMLQGLPQLIRG